MSVFADVQDFVRVANRVTELDELRSLMQGTVRSLGFDYFSLVHHAGLNNSARDFVRVVDYPSSWISMVVEKNYFSDDPVHAACQRTGRPFSWEEVGQIIPLTERQGEILQAAFRTGLGSGFTVPVHVPGDCTGSCSFGTKEGRSLPDETLLPFTQYLGSFAFEAARRVLQLKRKGTPSEPPEHCPPRLSQRQFDCIVLAGRGKSDRDVAQLLGISGETVHQHIEEAKRRYGVATRMQLVVRALFDSQLTFADLIH